MVVRAHQDVRLLGGVPGAHVARHDGHQVVPAFEGDQVLQGNEGGGYVSESTGLPQHGT